MRLLLILPARVAQMSDGKIVAWLPAEGDSGELFHMVHADGDEEDLETAEAAAALAAFAADQREAEAGEDEEEADGEAEEEEADGLADTDEEDADEEDEEEQDAEKRTLWPTWSARDKWKAAVKAAKTVGQLALDVLYLKHAATKFGLLQVAAGEAKAAKGDRKLAPIFNNFGYSMRAAAAAARAKMSQSRKMEDEDDIFEDEAPRKSRGGHDKRRTPQRKAVALKSPTKNRRSDRRR